MYYTLHPFSVNISNKFDRNNCILSTIDVLSFLFFIFMIYYTLEFIKKGA